MHRAIWVHMFLVCKVDWNVVLVHKILKKFQKYVKKLILKITLKQKNKWRNESSFLNATSVTYDYPGIKIKTSLILISKTDKSILLEV